MEANADLIFDQAENRLHAQKAILATLLGALLLGGIVGGVVAAGGPPYGILDP